MKTKNQDMEMEELFRRTLGEAEVIPEASTGSTLMRQVARREFMRFNPAKFNVYYLGALIVAGITATVILTSGNENAAQISPPDQSGEISSMFYADSSENKVEAAEVKKTDVQEEKIPESVITTPAETAKVAAETKPVPVIDNKKNDSVSPLRETTEKSTDKKSYPGAYAPESSKLQEGFRTVVSKIDYSKRTPPPRQNIKISPVVMNDSILNKDIFDEILPDSDELLEEDIKRDEPMVGVSATEGCPPLMVQFINKSGSSDSCRWTFGDIDYSYEKNPNRIFSEEGDHKVALDIYGNDGLKKNSSITINVYPKPQAKFEASPEKDVKPGDEIIFRNRSTNGVSFRWDFGDGTYSEQYEPKHSYTKPGSYNVRLMVTSDYGCTDTVTVVKAVLKKQ